MSDPDRLRITEIFYSLQGEAKTAGQPTVFIRLTGCPLRCAYCDTAYAFQGGEWMTITAILAEVKKYDTKFVTVTGGEPLAQKNCDVLLRSLCDRDYSVSLETSGALSIKNVDLRVSRVVDVKTPDSQESAKNLIENFQFLSDHDQLKFVICSRRDYEWSKEFIQKYKLKGKCEIWFSSSFEQLPPRQLAEWILEDQLSVRFQMQLHKLLWADEPGR